MRQEVKPERGQFQCRHFHSSLRRTFTGRHPGRGHNGDRDGDCDPPAHRCRFTISSDVVLVMAPRVVDDAADRNLHSAVHSALCVGIDEDWFDRGLTEPDV